MTIHNKVSEMIYTALTAVITMRRYKHEDMGMHSYCLISYPLVWMKLFTTHLCLLTPL